MDAQKFSINEFEENYEIKFFGLLGIKPKFNNQKTERYLTYSLILKDIIYFGKTDMLINIKYRLHRNIPIDIIFKELILNDTSRIFNEYKEIITHYSQEDITELFF